MEFNIELGSPDKTGVVLSVCSISPEIYNNAIITEKIVNKAQLAFNAMMFSTKPTENAAKDISEIIVIRKQIKIKPCIEISVFTNLYSDFLNTSMGIEDGLLYKYIYHTSNVFCSELKLMLEEELKNK